MFFFFCFFVVIRINCGNFIVGVWMDVSSEYVLLNLSVCMVILDLENKTKFGIILSKCIVR